MTSRRRNHSHSAVLLAASSALLGVGCSSGGDTGAGSDTSDVNSAGVGTDEMTLVGVRFDVRRDPG